MEETIIIADGDPIYGDRFRGDVEATFNSFEVNTSSSINKSDL